MTDGTLAILYEDENNHLYIAVNGATHAWDITSEAGNAEFEYDAVALLNGDTEHWTFDRIPLAVLDHPETRAIAQYDDNRGVVDVFRDQDSGRVLAGHTGRRYIGYLDKE